MILLYIILGLFCSAMIGGVWCITTRAGEKENICKYNDHGEEV